MKCFIILILFFCDVYTQDYSNETLLQFMTKQKNLIDNLFQGYQRELAPVYGRARYTQSPPAIQVNLTVSSAKLLKIDDSEQSAHLAFDCHIAWTDFRLKWNPDEHDEIEELILPDSLVWKPDFVPEQLISFKTTTTLSEGSSAFVNIRHTGLVEYTVRYVQVILCLLNISKFPKDSQVCKMRLTSYSLLAREITLNPSVHESFELSEVDNGEWTVKELMILNETTRISNNLEYPVGGYNVLIKRNSQFYTILIVIPSVILTFLAFIGMFFSRITKDSLPEKLNLGFSAILATIMIIQITTDNLPKSPYVPILSIFIVVNLFMEVASVVLLLLLGIFLLDYDKNAHKDGLLFSVEAKAKLNRFISKRIHHFLLVISLSLLLLNGIIFYKS
ncbi:unnamed protein product [Auanema sp. JU1783]|nr:unnamed protein product [Auanema sp. JU1783]